MATARNFRYDLPRLVYIGAGNPAKMPVGPWGDQQPISRTVKLDENRVNIDGHWLAQPAWREFSGPAEILSHQQ